MIKRIWVVGFRGSGKTELLKACSRDGTVPDQVHWWPLSVTTRDGNRMTEVGQCFACPIFQVPYESFPHMLDRHDEVDEVVVLSRSHPAEFDSFRLELNCTA